MNKPPISLALTQSAASRTQIWLRGPRGMLALVGLSVIVALAFGWYSLGFAAIAPVLYLLPCAAMMAMCAKGMGHNGDKASESGRACAAARSTAGDQDAGPRAIQVGRAE